MRTYASFRGYLVLVSLEMIGYDVSQLRLLTWDNARVDFSANRTSFQTFSCTFLIHRAITIKPSRVVWLAGRFN
jgi:hypothetical protein